MEFLLDSQITSFHGTLPKCHFHIFPTYHFQLPAKNLIIRHSLFMKEPQLFNSAISSVKPMPALMVDGIYNTSPSIEVLELWKNADAVCFDVDSTVCLDEGIDELAEFCDTREAVEELTARAMTGFVLFEKALADRLSIIKPSRQKVMEFLTQRPPSCSLEARASTLGLMRTNQPRGAEEKQLPWSTYDRVHGHKTIFMIGDGATDLEACKPGGADVFVCYAGVQLRKSVAAEADWVVLNFEELLHSLD